jgi:hypothetical protein
VDLDDSRRLGCTLVILYIIRFVLARRNKERREWAAGLSDSDRDGCLEEVDENGELMNMKVDLAILDLTDLENKFFIHPL